MIKIRRVENYDQELITALKFAQAAFVERERRARRALWERPVHVVVLGALAAYLGATLVAAAHASAAKAKRPEPALAAE